jgi:monoterpene epsilon-lactone hydrolase
MPSFAARFAGFALRTTGYYRRMFTGGPQFQSNIAKVRSLPTPQPVAKADSPFDVKQTSFKGRNVWHIAPNNRRPTVHVLFWHGGGYVYPATDVHWKFLTHMATAHGWSVTAPLYPLAPESTASDTTAWAHEYYNHFRSEMAGQPFVMGGDSAGGGLTAALAQMARDEGAALPAGLILICPWLNLDPSHPDQALVEPRDGILTLSGISEGGALYAGTLPRTDPRCSPIYGDWQGLPPILAFGGGDDILVTDARALKAKLPAIEHREEAGMLHDWPIFTFRESRDAQAQMAAFATRVTT